MSKPMNLQIFEYSTLYGTSRSTDDSADSFFSWGLCCTFLKTQNSPCWAFLKTWVFNPDMYVVLICLGIFMVSLSSFPVWQLCLAYWPKRTFQNDVYCDTDSIQYLDTPRHNVFPEP